MSKEVSDFYNTGKDFSPTCITYSFANLWYTNPGAFRKRFYRNEESPTNPAYVFGSMVSDLIKNEPNHPSLTNLPISRYTAIDEEYKCKLGDVDFVFHPDLFEPSTFTFGEVKTGMSAKSGKPAWDDKKVADHIQLECYSLGIESVFGQVNDACHFFWLVKDRTPEIVVSGAFKAKMSMGGEIVLTGECVSFERTITALERYRAKEWLVQAYHEISADFLLFKKNV